MKEETPREVQDFFDEIKHFVFDITPNTFTGFLIILIINVGIRKTNSFEFTISVASTGVYVFCFVMMYYLAKASLFLVNGLLSRNTSEKRIPEVE